MKHQIKLKNLEAEPVIKERLDHFISKLDKLLGSIPQEQAFLHGVLEKHSTKSIYRISLTLNVPGRTLAARESRRDLETTMKAAFDELERQVKRHKAFLRRENAWKRPARRAKIRQAVKMAPPQVDQQERERIFDSLQPYLKKLYNFVRREIVYFVSTGDLLPGELTVSDVVDEALLRAYREYNERPSDLRPDIWLVRIARNHLREEVKRRREERKGVLKVEQNVPDVPPAEWVQTLGDEILDFYQPDEDLRLEDVVKDPNVPTPEQIAESHELQQYIYQTLAKLPRSWRDAFTLHYVEGFTIAETAKLTGQTEEEVKRELQRTREFLRQKLIEAGLAA